MDLETGANHAGWAHKCPIGYVVWIHDRNTGYILKTIFAVDYKCFSDRKDNIDKLLLIVDGIFIVVFIVAIVLIF